MEKLLGLRNSCQVEISGSWTKAVIGNIFSASNQNFIIYVQTIKSERKQNDTQLINPLIPSDWPNRCKILTHC